MALLTPFQTVGPYLSLGLRVGLDSPGTGATVMIRGRLLDGRRDGIADGILEWWHPVFAGVPRCLTAADGSYVVKIIKPPASRESDGGEQAPHVAVRVLGRGILTQYITRVYFPGEPLNQRDPVLQLVPEERRHTLVASAISSVEYRFDVVVQGEHETVFFDI